MGGSAKSIGLQAPPKVQESDADKTSDTAAADAVKPPEANALAQEALMKAAAKTAKEGMANNGMVQNPPQDWSEYSRPPMMHPPPNAPPRASPSSIMAAVRKSAEEVETSAHVE